MLEFLVAITISTSPVKIPQPEYPPQTLYNKECLLPEKEKRLKHRVLKLISLPEAEKKLKQNVLKLIRKIHFSKICRLQKISKNIPYNHQGVRNH